MSLPDTDAFDVWLEEFWDPGSAVIHMTPEQLVHGIELLAKLRDCREDPPDAVWGMATDYLRHLLHRGLFAPPTRAVLVESLPLPRYCYGRIALMLLPSLRETLARALRTPRVQFDAVGQVVEFLSGVPKSDQGTLVLRRADGRLIDLVGPLELLRGIHRANIPGAELAFIDNHIGVTVRVRPRAEIRSDRRTPPEQKQTEVER
jgi:hypothetical protein